MGATAVTNVVLNLVLIPRLGYMGAAVSTILSYGMLAAVAGRVSQRWYRVPWEVGRVVAMLGSGWRSPRSRCSDPITSRGALACIVAYPVIAIGLRIVPGGLSRPWRLSCAAAEPIRSRSGATSSQTRARALCHRSRLNRSAVAATAAGS